MYNSRRPLNRLTVILTLTFDLIFIAGRGIVMDYLCAEFYDFIVSAVLVLSCGQTDRITEADQRYTHATTVGVSNCTLSEANSFYEHDFYFENSVFRNLLGLLLIGERTEVYIAVSYSVYRR